eukprot:TRINITY_DN5940_c1_g1_i1.p1 TRINITY_DN5940_c1_g1~~TRINITY_DN5940_c1_g1_i1.p1  ORF type:complete len:154 (+),score=14.59 TRINITY_DN5940_c1_g1_i1:70-531(+)
MNAQRAELRLRGHWRVSATLCGQRRCVSFITNRVKRFFAPPVPQTRGGLSALKQSRERSKVESVEASADSSAGSRGSRRSAKDSVSLPDLSGGGIAVIAVLGFFAAISLISARHYGDQSRAKDPGEAPKTLIGAELVEPKGVKREWNSQWQTR